MRDFNMPIRIISQQDLIDSNCCNFKEIIEVCEETFKKFSNNEVIFPDKISVTFNEENQNRINCLPAALLKDKVYGMKWVSVFPENEFTNQKANLSAVIVLSELESGYPLAFLEGSMCTNIRTAAVGAIGAKYLARKDSETIGFIGAGELAKSHFLAMMEVLPNIKKCKVSSKTKESEQLFIEQMSKIYPEIEFIACNTINKEAATDSDVIITAISSQEKVLQADWIKKGAFYCHVAGLEDDFAVPKLASKIVCDDWEVVKHRSQTISQMYKLGLLKDEDIYANIYEIINGEKKGRENQDEFIYFNSVGMSYLDVGVANWMYKKVIESNKGVEINLRDKSMFDAIY